MSLKQRAEACFRQNNLAEAEKLYTKAYQANRDDLDALFMLGAIHGQKNDLAKCESCFREVVRRSPEHYSAWDNLGIALMLQGKLVDAETCFRKSTQVNPGYAQAHNNLGNLLKGRGNYTEAISCYQRAIQILPGYSEAYNNLGGLYFEQEKTSEAIDCYKKALETNPNYPEAHVNLGNALHKLGNDAEAISCFQQALKIQPGNMEVHKQLGTLYWNSHRIDDAIASIYRVLKTSPDVVSTFPLKAAIRTVLTIPGLQALVNAARQPGCEPLEQHILEGRSAPVFQDSILLTAMLRVILADLDLEILFTKTRQLCLHAVLHKPKDYFDSLFGSNNNFIAALACQCFNNEYVYIVSETEYTELAQLTAELSTRSASHSLTDATLQRMLIIFGMYTPLYMSDEADKFLTNDSKLPEYLQKLIQQQIRDPAREEHIRSEIPSITDITDEVSVKVGQQYDEAPFPRWLDITTPSPRPYSNVLRVTFGATHPVPFTDKRIKILVAGCGTGHHAISTAAQYTDADVLAIDISINCLAYAKRKAEEMGIRNVTFKHADILELGDFTERFHVIEVVGVLQTMNEPDTALRTLVNLLHPQGFVKIGLYSKKARRHIAEASVDFKSRGFTSRDDDIRRLRQEIIAMDESASVRKTAVQLKDFYSMPECRNTYFLVHEVEHTISDIATMLDRADLEFLLFNSPNNVADTNFDTVFPAPNDKSDLAAWDTVEERYPDTFINMYSLWCQRKT